MKVIALLSPAKTVVEASAIRAAAAADPPLLAQADRVQRAVREHPDQGSLWNIKQAPLLKHFRELTDAWVPAADPERAARSAPASCVFGGGVAFKALDPEGLYALGDDIITCWLNENLFILSGSYGVVRGGDAVQPVRCDMGTRKLTEIGSLYDYWEDHVWRVLAHAVDHDDPEEDLVVVDVASSEYSKAVDFKALRDARPSLKVVRPCFKDGGVTRAAYAKPARGAFCRFLATAQPTTLEDLRSFDLRGYRYGHSTTTKDGVIEMIFEGDSGATAKKNNDAKRRRVG